ncbi:MAG: hypothetical protein ACHQ50_01740 [Fimbriimonadales bacterium]
MRSAIYIGTVTATHGTKRLIWQLNRPFKDVIPEVAAALSPSQGWKMKGDAVDPKVFYTNTPRRIVIVVDGAMDGKAKLSWGTSDRITTILTEGY